MIYNLKIYFPNPEDYLTHRGMLVQPQQPLSPTNDEKKHKYEMEDKKIDVELEDKRWKSCCFDLHQESSLFFAKISVSVLVITLCGYQLITLKDCNYQSLYSSLLSSVITFWLSKK
jgi:hypothetical protein